jgi:hypothetical protein
MAKSRTPTVRRVTTREERKRPSVFLRLKVDENFTAHALFEPDPEAEDNPGYFEYFDHYDQQANTYVPCAGDKCPFCLANDNPSTRAMSLWYLPDNAANEQLKVFTMNFSTANDAMDIAEEENGILGKKFRVKRISDRGEYRIRPQTTKALSKGEVKKLLKSAPDLEELVNDALKRQWERLRAMEELAEPDDEEVEDTEDDEDEDEQPPARKGKRKPVEAEADEDEDEDDEEPEDEADEADEDEEEEDEEEADEPEAEDEAEEEEADDELVKAEVEVVKPNEDDETIDVKMDGSKFTLWVGDGVEVEWLKVKKGTTLVIDAAQDDEGDWVASSLKVKRARAGGRKK